MNEVIKITAPRLPGNSTLNAAFSEEDLKVFNEETLATFSDYFRQSNWEDFTQSREEIISNPDEPNPTFEAQSFRLINALCYVRSRESIYDAMVSANIDVFRREKKLFEARRDVSNISYLPRIMLFAVARSRDAILEAFRSYDPDNSRAALQRAVREAVSERKEDEMWSAYLEHLTNDFPRILRATRSGVVGDLRFYQIPRAVE